MLPGFFVLFAEMRGQDLVQVWFVSSGDGNCCYTAYMWRELSWECEAWFCERFHNFSKRKLTCASRGISDMNVCSSELE